MNSHFQRALRSPRRHRDERGAALIELIIIVGVVALVALGAFQLFGRSASDLAERETECIRSLQCGHGSPYAGAGGAGPAGGAPASTGAGGTSTPALPNGANPTAAGPERPRAPDGPRPPGGPDRPQGPTAGVPASNLPAQIPPADKGFWQSTKDVAAGFVVDGLWGTVTGIGSAIAHPIDTASAVGSALAHPVDTAAAIRDGVVKAWDENPERFVGAAIFEIASAPLAAAKAGKAAKVADAVGDAAKVGAKAGGALVDRLPHGATVLRTGGESGDSWIVYRNAAGEERIRFRAEEAKTRTDASAGRGYSVEDEAMLDAKGNAFVNEGRHRAVGAAHGDVIPEDLGGVPGQPGVLDYKFYDHVTKHEGVNIKDLTIDYDKPDLPRADAERKFDEIMGRP